MQRLIVSNHCSVFDTRVNEMLSAGCTVVPGTLTMAMTNDRTRYAVVVEQPDDFEDSVESTDEALDPAHLCERRLIRLV